MSTPPERRELLLPYLDPERELAVLLPEELKAYLASFYKRLQFSPEIVDRDEEIVEFVYSHALAIIERNNSMASFISSPEYSKIVQKEKELRGPCALGASICIDGRLPILHMLGRVVNCWEKAAGEIKIEPSQLDNSPQLASGRLTEAIIDRAKKGPLLEILIAHTSLSDPENHGCGAMKARQARGEFPPDCDLVVENLKLHKQGAQAITALYNRAVEEYGGKSLEKVAITALYDTDTMGLILGYGQEKPFFTTDLLNSLTAGEDSTFTERLSAALQDNYQARIYSMPGIMKDKFTDLSLSLIMEKMIYDTTRLLIKYNEFLTPLKNCLDSTSPELTPEQERALTFLMARTVAFQYLTGLYQKQEYPKHPFADHGEGYQAISLDGVIPGQFDPEVQVFGASPDTPEEAIGHILTQCEIMDKNKKTEKPYLLFVSKASSEALSQAALERDRKIFEVVNLAI